MDTIAKAAQIVPLGRRNESLKYVTAILAREEMMLRQLDEQAEKIQELEAAQGTERRAIGDHITRIADLERENGHLRDGRDQLEEDNEQFRTERTATPVTVKELDERNLLSRDHAKSCEQAKTSLATTFSDLKERASRAEAKVRELHISRASLSSKNSTLVSKNEDVLRQNSILVQDIENLGNRSTGNHSTRKCIDAGIFEALTDEIEYLRQAKATLQGKLNSLLDNIQKHTEQPSVRQSVIQDVRVHKDRLHANGHADDIELQRLRSLNADLGKKLMNQQKCIDRFNKDLSKMHELSKQKKSAEKEAATKAKQLETLRQELDARTTDITRLEHESMKFQQQATEADRSVTRAAEKEYALLSRLSSLQRSTNHELVYAETERLICYEEDYNYFFANTRELAEADAATRRAKVGELRNQLASLKDELEPTQRDLNATRTSLELSQAQREMLSSKLDRYKRKLESAYAKITAQRDENVRLNGKLALERSTAEIATNQLKQQLAVLEARLSVAHTAEVTLKQDIDELKVNASKILPNPGDVSEAIHGRKQYTSHGYIQAEILGISGDQHMLLMQKYWETMAHFYRDMPDHRVTITLGGRVLTRGGEPICGDGNSASATAEQGPQESLPRTSSESMEIEVLIKRTWKPTEIDFSGVELKKPGRFAKGLLHGVRTCAACETGADDNLAQEINLSPSQETAPSQWSVVTLATDGAQSKEDSLFVPETPPAKDNAESGKSFPGAVGPTGDPGTQEREESQLDYVLNKQTQFVAPPAIMLPPEATEAPVKGLSAREHSSKHGVNRLRTDLTATAMTQSPPAPCLTTTEQRQAKDVRCPRDLPTPVSAVHQSAGNGNPLKRHGSDLDVPARAQKQPRLSGPAESRGFRRRVRCRHDPKCNRNDCYYAHQSPAVFVKVGIDVATPCIREEDCDDANCRLAHASRNRCMKVPAREKRHFEPKLDRDEGRRRG